MLIVLLGLSGAGAGGYTASVLVNFTTSLSIQDSGRSRQVPSSAFFFAPELPLALIAALAQLFFKLASEHMGETDVLPAQRRQLLHRPAVGRAVWFYSQVFQ